ncbi:MAG: alanine--tRNA ligase [Candidatus Dormibacteria bacterium]
MRSPEIRQSFLNFFAGRGHLVLPSSSLIPQDDPTVLLTTAGMQQFKPYYAGTSVPPALRVATAQKCFRTVDLDEVGDYSHLTLFEMLGNFSFGDYFKQGAIEMAWEYLTVELGLPPGRLWPAVYPEDTEAASTWRRVCGRDPYPLEDNFWPSSLTGWVGPCGPDSEIYFDRGATEGCGSAACHPGHCDRYLELWNLVFPQYDRRPDGGMDSLEPPGIDTGMGLERLALVLGGFSSIHETDVFAALNHHFHERSVDQERDSEAAAYARRLLADHSRATAFLVADGVRPGNEGRGYVLRKMIRRATLHGVRRLGLEDGLSGAVDLVGELMGDAYPEVVQRAGHIRATLAAEEAAFRRTLEQGEAAFAEVVRRSSHIIGGEDAFRLHDTYGFPIELTAELAAEAGMVVDRTGFDVALAEQRQRSRRAAKRNPAPRTGLSKSEFVGHDKLTANARVLRLFLSAAGEVPSATEGDDVEVYLQSTPFYAEAGGQVGDIGILEGPGGTVEVRDVQKQGEAFAHYGTVTSGRLASGEEVSAQVDAEARWATMRHHSATHLVHSALRAVLGDETQQQGSYVGPESCSFDFNLPRATSAGELDSIFGIVNRVVREDIERSTRVLPIEEARRSGAMQLFGEKYGDMVRVVNFGDASIEFCGGTHVNRTGQVGMVIPVRESSVGAGVRRIEFLAGAAAERRVRELQTAMTVAAARLNVRPTELPGRLEQLLDERKQLQRQLDDLKRGAAGRVTGAAHVLLGSVAVQELDSVDAAVIRDAADHLLDAESAAGAALVIGRAGTAGRVALKARDGAGFDAGKAFREVAESGVLTGGGNQRLAQGGFAPGQFAAIRSALLVALGIPGEVQR